MIALLVLVSIFGGAFAQNCTQYCANISTTCTGTLQQYAVNPDTFGICMSACASFPYAPNNASLAQAGDSYQCRIYHLSVAATPGNAQIHCPHAGFNGGPGTCGTYCQAYCDNIFLNCNTTVQVFQNYLSCMQECSFFPLNASFDLASDAVPSGNSINCRTWHSQAVPVAGANPHCIHASPQGGQQCGTASDNYCDTITATCTGANKQWSNWTQCHMAASSYPLQTMPSNPYNQTTTGNSLPCRKYHAIAAIGNPVFHCPHAGPLGGEYCGTECEAYCTLLNSACSNDYTMCFNNCGANLTSSDTTPMSNILMGKVKPGSVGCGTYYAIGAFNDASWCQAAAMATGSLCKSAAFSLQASWTFLAFIILALGFSF